MNPVFLKLIGKRAKPCKQCQSLRHWVNSIGGILCLSCKPKPSENASVGELRILNGLWAPYDAADDFDFQPDATIQRPPATRPPAKLDLASLPPNLRGSGGELSAFEVDLFTKDLIWDVKDTNVVLKPRTRAFQKMTISGDKPKLRQRRIRRDQLPVIGSEIKTTRPIKTFGGTIPPGSTLIVSQSNHDGFGEVCVSLRNEQREVLSGMMLEEI